MRITFVFAVPFVHLFFRRCFLSSVFRRFVDDRTSASDRHAPIIHVNSIPLRHSHVLGICALTFRSTVRMTIRRTSLPPLLLSMRHAGCQFVGYVGTRSSISSSVDVSFFSSFDALLTIALRHPIGTPQASMRIAFVFAVRMCFAFWLRMAGYQCGRRFVAIDGSCFVIVLLFFRQCSLFSAL